MATTRIKDGKLLTYTASGAAVSSGDVVEFGADATGFIGVAVADIADGYNGAVDVSSVFELAAENDTAWTQGDLLYWDGTKLTKTSTANHAAGYAAAAKAQTAAVGQCKLAG